MFMAVRRWWSGRDKARIAGLFAFEFTVVVLGVLTAQAVADWSRDRTARRDMLASKAEADQQAARLAAASVAYGRVIPCMDGRMMLIMRAASSGQPLDPAMLVRPTVRSDPFTPLSGENLIHLRKYYGREVANSYVRLAGNHGRFVELVAALADGWQSLTIISPEAGRVGPGDRQEARVIAARMRSTLRSLRQMNRNIVLRAGELGIVPRLDPGLRMPRDCKQFWQQNSVVFDPDDVPLTGDRLPPAT